MKKNLRFRDGKFKMMQMTDIQDTPGIDKETIRLIEAALDQEKPDLVVLTGDQVKGYSPKLRGERKKNLRVSSLAKFAGRCKSAVFRSRLRSGTMT